MQATLSRTLCLISCAAGSVCLLGTVAHAGERFYHVQLGSFAGGQTSVAAINERGEIAGCSGTSWVALGMHPFISTNGGPLLNLNAESFDYSGVYDINEVGQVLGYGCYAPASGNGVCESSMFRYTPGVGMEIITTHNGWPKALNNAGTAVGYFLNPSAGGQSEAFVFSDTGGFQPLPDFGGFSTYANAINDAGVIVGETWGMSGSPGARPIRWVDGVAGLIAPADRNGGALEINEAGVIVGWLSAAGSTVPFYYSEAAGLQEIPLPAGATYGTALLINEYGTVVGTFTDAEFVQHAFLFRPGGDAAQIALPIGTAQVVPMSINNRDEWVGTALGSDYSSIGVYYSAHTGLIRLDTALQQPIAGAVSINDSGQIAAGYDFDGGVLISAGRAGDVNCDGSVDSFDTPGFVKLLSDPAGHAAAHPTCDGRFGDINGDGAIDSFDISAFVACLAGNCE